MYRTLVVVHLLIITIISLDSFPIDLQEIEYDDIYLVDKERKGRFIEVNQTTFLPNTSIELIREKKSSMPQLKKSAAKNDSIVNDEEQETGEINKLESRSPDWHDLKSQNKTTGSGLLVDSHAFGYPSFFEDHFTDDFGDPSFPNAANRMLNSEFLKDNCCHLDTLDDIFSREYFCIDNFIVPDDNLIC